MTTRPTYANVASTLAVVIALGGTGAYAAGLGKDSVTSAQIKNGTIKGVDVKNNGLTGKDVKESSLGKVPSAASVDSVRHLTAAPAAGQTLPLLSRPPFALSAVCTAGGISKIALTTAADHARWVTSNNQDPDFLVADGAADFGPVSNGIAQILVSAVSADGVSLNVQGNATADGAGHCRVDVVVIG